MTVDAEELIHRMNKLIDIHSKHGYMEEVMFRIAVGYCIDIINEVASENNDTGRLHKIPGKRQLRAKVKKLV